MSHQSPLEVIDSQIVWSCPWYRIRRDGLRLENGRSAEYFVVDKGEAVFVIPVTPRGEIILIRHWRHTVQAWCWEVPAGNIPAGLDAAAAAREELHEEVGGQAATLTYAGEFFSMNGISNERSHLFVAQGVVVGESRREPLEILESHALPPAKVAHMLEAGEIKDALSALALFMTRSLWQLDDL